MKVQKYTCPCCGYGTFAEKPGSYSICEICFWEDDAAQLIHLSSGGANINLIDAQKNYQEFGAIEARFINNVRKPTPEDAKDPKWRPVDLQKDKSRITPVGNGMSYFNSVIDADKLDFHDLYYWNN